MYGAARATERAGDPGLTPPSFWGILLGGLPRFVREGFLPLGAFYAGYKLSGLTAGIAASTATSALIYVRERRAGREAIVVRIALAWVIVRALIGLFAHSSTAYFAAPVLANGLWGAAFLVSIVVGRPLAGLLACAWYPFPPEFRQTAAFRRVFAIESAVWGVYLLAVAAIRGIVLIRGSIESFIAISIVAGTPATLALLAWSIWFTIRRLDDGEASAT